MSFFAPRRPRLIFGFMEECGFCHQARPQVHALCREVPALQLVEVNVDRGGKMPFPVGGFPAVVLQAPDGRVVAHAIGITKLQDFRAWLRDAVTPRRSR